MSRDKLLLLVVIGVGVVTAVLRGVAGVSGPATYLVPLTGMILMTIVLVAYEVRGRDRARIKRSTPH